MRMLGCIILAAFSVQAAQAVVLEFTDVRADQTVGSVTIEEGGAVQLDAPSFLVKSGEIKTGAIQAEPGLASYRWTLIQSVDVDGDGLKDAVTITLEIDGKQPYSAFSPNGTGRLAKGDSLTFRVASVECATVNGETRHGAFAGFTGIELAQPAGIRLNGQAYRTANGRHAIAIEAPTLSIQPLLGESGAPSIAGVSFKVALGDEADRPLPPSVMVIALGCIGPSILLLLRKREKV